MSRVSVCFWFDVEDYITPESDDALKSLLDIFIQRGATGTWKIVGEKYRALRRRERGDVLDLLQRQDIGYHTDNHSRHPVISEYVAGLGWKAGAEEFDRRERPGLEELRREFGHISCYGQPGGAWSPQAFDVLTRWGVPMYLDEGHHVGLEQQPFWFQNTFTAFNLQQNCVRADVSLADKASALEAARADLYAAVEGLEGKGGFVSIYYHPCEFSTSKFWDGVNFARGKNPPPSEWRSSPLLAPEEARARLDVFAGLLDMALEHPGVYVVDATELLGRYKGIGPQGPVAVRELIEAAGRMGGGITYARSAVGAVSPAEMLTGVLGGLERWADAGSLPEAVEVSAPLGPIETGAQPRGGSMSVGEAAGAARSALAYLRAEGHMPAAVKAGSASLAPEDLFAASAAALKAVQGGAGSEASISFAPMRLALEDNIAKDGPGMWGWVPFPEGFSARDLLELTRLQAWTLKPAELQ